MIACRHNTCKHAFSFPYVEYRPAEGEQSASKKRTFDEAVREIESIVSEGMNATRETHPDLFTKLDAHRTERCKGCRDSLKRSQQNPATKVGQCRAYWYKLRTVECAECVLEGKWDERNHSEYDHQSDDGPKVHKISDYSWWACNGGVEAMRAEVLKCIPRCAWHHRMQQTHSIHKRKFETLEEMPTVTHAQKKAKLQRGYMDKKYAYVNARKMEIGKCADEECTHPTVVEGMEYLFDFAHLDASTKTKGWKGSVSKICNSSRTLKTCIPYLEKEMSASTSRLLCFL